MSKKISRRKVIKSTAKFLAVTYMGHTLIGCASEDSDSSSTSTSTSDTTLFIPPVVTPDGSNNISLQANEGTTQFYSGFDSVTKGFVDVNNAASTAYLGPTIRVSSTNSNSTASGTPMVDQGTQKAGANNVNFSISNNTSTTISAHWHGLHIDGYVDGGPYNAITAGSTWSPTLPIYQQAGMNWYHTHIHGTTAIDVYKGLAGLFIIDDTNSKALDAAGLPSTYGVDDIPLIIQDKKFVNSVLDSSNTGGRFAGETFLVNGTVSPIFEVEAGLNRFRILNASNARFYDFTIDNDGISVSFQKIATDGGFLAAPVNLTSLRMGPGERNEIVVDFSNFSAGDTLTLKSVDNSNTGLGSFTLMTFTVIAQTSQTSGNSVPTTLNGNFATDRTTLMAKTPDAYVAIDLRGGANPFYSARSTTASPTPVQVTLDTTTANFVSTSTQTTANYTEEWTITGANHPFHLHGCHAMIKSIGGNSVVPDEMQGWKDVFEVDSQNGTANTNSPIVFLVQFDEKAYASGSNAGSGAGTDFMYMMHCHILGHEDAGMMGCFEVI
ncbi:MAG: hypothetical protein COB67_03080 [SAR324 cluster bacterium]|uniref:Plastocyanin-like domain-containing protein n=1 Tax=SAR324 cluster bacterium TaxID=2024889 RepID=A0A2A4T8F3_9DELT|nr:MAG: hypothetical protein COB67_03080 [SAR324 cluster bacterium]